MSMASYYVLIMELFIIYHHSINDALVMIMNYILLIRTFLNRMIIVVSHGDY